MRVIKWWFLTYQKAHFHDEYNSFFVSDRIFVTFLHVVLTNISVPVDGVPYRLAPDFSCYGFSCCFFWLNVSHILLYFLLQHIFLTDIMAQNLITCSVETFEKILELNNISEKIRGGKRTEEEQRYLTGEFLAASYDLLTPSTKYHFASQVSHHTHRMSGLFSCIASIVKCFPSKYVSVHDNDTHLNNIILSRRDTRWFTEKCAQVFLQDPPHNLPLLRATLCVCQVESLSSLPSSLSSLTSSLSSPPMTSQGQRRQMWGVDG